MKKIFLLFVLALATTYVKAQTTTVYVVRHAEKDTSNPSERDPALNADGQARAIALDEKLKDVDFTAIFSTNYKRTKDTAKPLADRKKLTIETYNPSNPKLLADKIKADFAGKTVLIVGHSNTVQEMVEAFGAEKPLKPLTDDDYDNLFRVVIKDGTPKASAEKFGKVHNSGN